MTQHVNLTEEQLARLGLENAKDSLCSPLCYATLLFVREKTGIPKVGPLIFTTPPHKIVLRFPSEKECRHLSAVYSRWLAVNFRSATWHADIHQFRAAARRSIDMSELYVAVVNVINRESDQKMQEDEKSKAANGARY